MKNNFRLLLGSVNLHFWHTPGHTLESSCILLSDRANKEYNENKLEDYGIKAIFTGDTLFLGDVGRPDLTTSSDKSLSKFDLAKMMFDSVQRLARLPNEVVIFPGHGAGSACGKNISSATSCTIGNQKQKNYAFLTEDKQEFIKTLTSNIPAPPNYFFYNAALNKTGNTPLLSEIQKNADHSLSVEEFKKKVDDPHCTILDCRSPPEYQKCHVPRSLFSPLKGKFAIWAGNLIADSQRPIVLLCSLGSEKECITRLARTGVDKVIGYFTNFQGYLAKGYPCESVKTIEPLQVFGKYQSNLTKEQIVDVRNLGEFNSGHIDKAQLVSLNVLNKNLFKISQNKQVLLHCRSGTRSLVAYSFLDFSGFQNIQNINGGYKGMLQLGFNIQVK